MRLNKFIAQATGLSRRAVDTAITKDRVEVNGQKALLGQAVEETDRITLDGQIVTRAAANLTVMLNKPVGYVCSRDGQGSETIYDLLPPELHYLKPVGRLDKDSSGLILLTNDGDLANRLTHPSFVKVKIYEIELDRALEPRDRTKIEQGVELEDGVSRLRLEGESKRWRVTMHEGRNRQIRRTFEALGYRVSRLHRTQFGPTMLDDLAEGHYRILQSLTD